MSDEDGFAMDLRSIISDLMNRDRGFKRSLDGVGDLVMLTE